MSVSLFNLWVPILLSGFFVWLASALIHMVVKYHNSDYKKLNKEQEIAMALRQSDDLPGLYSMPYCSDMKELNDISVQQRFSEGPVAMITVMNKGIPAMGKLLIQQLLFFILGSTLIAYAAALSLHSGAEALHIFHVSFVIAFGIYAWSSVPYSIWFGHPWLMTFKYFLDAAIYAVVVGLTYVWLWP